MSTYRLEKVFAPNSVVLSVPARRIAARAQSPAEPARGGIRGPIS